MEEIEVPLEHAHEKIMETAQHESGGRRWIEWVALSSALLAVAAAVAALLSGHHANEALIEQLKSSDRWSFFQAKGIKASILETRIQILQSSHPDLSKEKEKLETYKKEQEGISEEAKEFEKSSEKHLNSHQIFSRAVTFFQVAIAVSAISVLVRKRRFWFVSLVFACVGIGFLIQGLLST